MSIIYPDKDIMKSFRNSIKFIVPAYLNDAGLAVCAKMFSDFYRYHFKLQPENKVELLAPSLSYLGIGLMVPENLTIMTRSQHVARKQYILTSDFSEINLPEMGQQNFYNKHRLVIDEIRLAVKKFYDDGLIRTLYYNKNGQSINDSTYYVFLKNYDTQYTVPFLPQDFCQNYNPRERSLATCTFFFPRYLKLIYQRRACNEPIQDIMYDLLKKLKIIKDRKDVKYY
jgi:hypothetical protein